MKDYDLLFFKIGQQYIKSSIYLMKAICRNGNETGAVADTIEEAVKITDRKVELSDLTLLLPALFDYCHGFELYIKGLIYLYTSKKCEYHDIRKMVNKLNNICDNKKLVKVINELYISNEGMLKDYKEKNGIKKQSEFYVSLRYPMTKDGKIIDYDCIRYNGRAGIIEIKQTIKKLKELNMLIIEEYNKKNHNSQPS